jgi:hypothetical protein
MMDWDDFKITLIVILAGFITLDLEVLETRLSRYTKEFLLYLLPG